MRLVMRLRGILAICLFLLLLDARAALPQSTFASIRGLVRDGEGGAIPQAQVSLHNLDTDQTATTATGRTGDLQFVNLTPGRYEISIDANGFARLSIPVTLHVGDNRSIEATLEIASRRESVSVEGKASEISDSSSVATVIERQLLSSLPLNGRSFSSLIPLAPGVTILKTSGFSQGQFSVNGQRGNANYLTVDGVGANIALSSSPYAQGQGGSGSLFGAAVTGGLNNLASVDAVQEFRIETSSFAAEFGRTPGGQVQIETRSGTKQFHGSAFDYFRNDALDARDWFQPAATPAPKLRQNDFGGVLGGPVFIPSLYDGHARTFFFASYEGLRLQQPNTGLTLTPSLAARAASPPALRPFILAYPIPNGIDYGDGTAQYFANFSNKTVLDATSVRLDHSYSDRGRLFFRGVYSPSHKLEYGGTNNSGDYASGNAISSLQTTVANTRTFTLGATQVLSPRVVNEARLNYSAIPVRIGFTIVPIGGAQTPAVSAILPAFADIGQDGVVYSLQGLPSLRYGKGLRGAQRQINFVDNLSYTVGAHRFKSGFDYRRLYPHTEPQRFQQELYNSGIGDLTGTEQEPGTLLSGLISSVEIDSFSPATLLFQNWSAYVQDDWHVAARLTVNVGLRWDVNPAPRAANGPPLLAVDGTDDPIHLAPATRGSALYRTQWRNFAPRLGLAYALSRRPGHETTIRGAGGIFYDLGYGILASSTAGYPYYRTNFYSNTPFPLPPDIGRIIQPSDNNPLTGFFADRRQKTPRTYEWNAAIEHSFGPPQSLIVTYAGALGRKLLRTEYYTNPNPNFIYPLITRNGGTSDYHALQVQFRRRMANSLQALVSYSWAHSIDLTSDDADGLFNSFPGTSADAKRDRASSDFDVRHTLTAAVTYELPKLRNAARIAEGIWNGWALNGILTARSATPVDLIGGYVNEPFYTAVRPDRVAGQPVYLADANAPGQRRLNPAAFVAAPSDMDGNALRQGTLGRNAVRGFPLNQLDLSLRRRFGRGEKLGVEVSADAFNLLNHPNFGQPNNNLTSGLFGQATAMFGRDLGGGSTAGGFNTLYQTGGPRSVQLALRVRF